MLKTYFSKMVVWITSLDLGDTKRQKIIEITDKAKNRIFV